MGIVSVFVSLFCYAELLQEVNYRVEWWTGVDLGALSLEDEMGSMMRNLSYHQDRGEHTLHTCSFVDPFGHVSNLFTVIFANNSSQCPYPSLIQPVLRIRIRDPVLF